MSRNPFPTTQMQNLWKEAIEKEAQARLEAFQRLKGKTRITSNQAEVYRKRQELNKSALIQIKPPAIDEIKHHRKNAEHVSKVRNENILYDTKADDTRVNDTRVNDFKTSKVNIMRPVSPLVKATLYDGYSRLGQGRKNYLKERHSKNPEDKFIFPITTSWDYGWRLGDVINTQEIKRPKFAQCEIMKKTFYRRNGLRLRQDISTV
ncbi:Protein atp6v1fnb [Bulinus truncatus]|nr:Protein atp6v1fnb [Bulinus truncatus]